MNRIDRLLGFALGASFDSPMKPRVGALLVRGNRIIKSACNVPGKPKFIGSWSRHAEVRATLNVNSHGASIVVARQHGILKSPVLARPCKHCIEWLQWVGVKEMIYTVTEWPYYKIESIDGLP